MARMLLLNNVVNSQTNQVEGFCLVKSVLSKLNIKDKAYLDFILADANGEITAKLWDYDPAVHGIYAPGDTVKVRATINLFRDAEQLKIDRIRPVNESDDVDMSMLVPSAPIDIEAMYSELQKTIAEFSDDDIRRLVSYLLRENEADYKRWPAALKLHHAQRGGLMFHTMSMLRMAKHVCTLYPLLDSDLVYAGIILHDIAKIKELSVSEIGIATSYSFQGQLLGHITMGVAMVSKAADILCIPEETSTLLQHILLSHHSIPEYGSPKPPMFPEAEVVSQLDILDARMFEMFDALSSVKSGEFSERQWALDNRQLYKHGRKING